MTAHPGSYCSPLGGTDNTKSGTAMVCSVPADKPGERARWRRNGPAPVRTPRRRGRASKATGPTLPQANTGIDPTRTEHAVPEAADAQASTADLRNLPHASDRTGPDAVCTLCNLPAINPVHTNSIHHPKFLAHKDLVQRAGGPKRPDETMEQYDDRLAPHRTDDDPAKVKPAAQDKPMTDDEIADRIRQAYGDLAEKQDRPAGLGPATVRLTDLRRELNDIPKEDLDKALDKLIRSPDTRMTSELDQRKLTDADRDAAVNIGGEPRHMLRIEPKLSGAHVPMTDDDVADKIRQAYGAQPDKWMKMKDLAAATGLTPEEIARGTRELMKDDNFRAEPEPFSHRVQNDDKAVAPVIGGEARHKLAFMDRVTAIPTDTAPAAPAAEHNPPPAQAQPTAAPTVNRPATALPVDGHYTEKAAKPNNWGSIPNPNVHTLHYDGALPQGVESLGRDAQIDMGGEPLADTILDLGDQVRDGRLHPSELPERLAAVRDRLPKDSRAHRVVSQMADDVDAPMTTAPYVPEGTPEPLRKLVTELHRIPIVRQRPERELHPVADLAKRLAAGEIRGRDAERELYRMNRHEMQSDTGSIQINDLVESTRQQLEKDRLDARRRQERQGQ